MTSRQIATLAAKEIRDAISQINQEFPQAMVIWPLEIKILNDGDESIFEFVELLKNEGEIEPIPTN